MLQRSESTCIGPARAGGRVGEGYKATPRTGINSTKKERIEPKSYPL